MPRKLREEEAGAVVHVFARGNNRQRIFRCNYDRELYLSLLGQVVARQGWLCLSYCLMHNHVHLLVHFPPTVALSRLVTPATGVSLPAGCGRSSPTWPGTPGGRSGCGQARSSPARSAAPP